MITIYFKCLDCQQYNRQNAGMPEFESRITRFDSFTQAFEHVYETSHEIVVESEQSQEDE